MYLWDIAPKLYDFYLNLSPRVVLIKTARTLAEAQKQLTPKELQQWKNNKCQYQVKVHKT
jgi:hypothetical protein